MAYRVLIADDEEKIVKLILKLGNWEKLGIEVVATCQDGEESIQAIRRFRPDIVLTDIKMPIYDGLQLIQMTQEEGIQTHFIVLSGYKHFEYAHSAIRLGVVDYLLKPLDQEQLNLALEKACRIIDANSKSEQADRELEGYHKQDRHKKLCELLLSSVPNVQFPANNQECNQLYMTDFQFSLYRCLWLSTNLGILLDSSQSMFLEKMQEIIPKVFDANYRWTAINNTTCVILLLNYPPSQKEKVQQRISALYYSLKNQVEIYGDFTLSIGVSLEKTDIRKIGEAVKESETAEWGRLVLRGVNVLDYDLLKQLPRFSIRDILPESKEAQLSNAVRLFQREEVARLFGQIENTAKNFSNHYPGDMAQFLRHLVKVIFQNHSDDGIAETLNEIYDELYLHNKAAQYFHDEIRFIYTYTDKLLSEKLKQIQSQRSRPVDEARRYIDANCHTQLSLTMVAEMVHLSPAYFSKLFKNETGIGFSEYLVDIRIKKSRELLLHSDCSIRSIAEQVGYPDEKYFCRLFKKQVGIKPSEYRKLYLGKSK